MICPFSVRGEGVGEGSVLVVVHGRSRWTIHPRMRPCSVGTRHVRFSPTGSRLGKGEWSTINACRFLLLLVVVVVVVEVSFLHEPG